MIHPKAAPHYGPAYLSCYDTIGPGA